MQNQGESPTCYEILQVHPGAPLDLITAVYWLLAGKAQAMRASDPEAEMMLHVLTRAYQVLADHSSRVSHDKAAGIEPQAATPKLPARRRGLFGKGGGKAGGDDSVDYYEVLRVSPTAIPAVIEEAYFTLRTYYLRLVHAGGARPELLDYLEEAFAITSDADRRRAYDEARHQRLERAGRAPGAKTARRAGESPRVVDSPPDKAGRGVPAPDSPPEPMASAGDPAAVSSPKTGAAAATLAKPRAPASEPTVGRVKPAKRKPAPSVNVKANGLKTAAEEITQPVRSAEHTGASPIKTVTDGASSLVRTLGRQLDTMSKRELEIEQEVASRRGLDRGEDREAEDALLRRLSSRATDAAVSGDTRATAPVRLELVGGPGSGTEYELTSFPLTLGGDEDCDVNLPGLAGHRARLLYRDGLFVVYNLAGPDGAEPDAESVPWWVLESGEDLRLGPYILRLTARAG